MTELLKLQSTQCEGLDIGGNMNELELKFYLSEILEKFEKYATMPRPYGYQAKRNFELFKLKGQNFIITGLTFKEISNEFNISVDRTRQVFIWKKLIECLEILLIKKLGGNMYKDFLAMLCLIAGVYLFYMFIFVIFFLTS